ncbi:MAG: hypothetical protein HY680_06130 [Chloroflexi bacterium]|nr:hypothetical protein [Chloroflexota bacterium]
MAQRATFSSRRGRGKESPAKSPALRPLAGRMVLQGSIRRPPEQQARYHFRLAWQPEAPVAGGAWVQQGGQRSRRALPLNRAPWLRRRAALLVAGPLGLRASWARAGSPEPQRAAPGLRLLPGLRRGPGPQAQEPPRGAGDGTTPRPPAPPSLSAHTS